MHFLVLIAYLSVGGPGFEVGLSAARGLAEEVTSSTRLEHEPELISMSARKTSRFIKKVIK